MNFLNYKGVNLRFPDNLNFVDSIIKHDHRKLWEEIARGFKGSEILEVLKNEIRTINISHLTIDNVGSANGMVVRCICMFTGMFNYTVSLTSKKTKLNDLASELSMLSNQQLANIEPSELFELCVDELLYTYVNQNKESFEVDGLRRSIMDALAALLNEQLKEKDGRLRREYHKLVYSDVTKMLMREAIKQVVEARYYNQIKEIARVTSFEDLQLLVAKLEVEVIMKM